VELKIKCTSGQPHKLTTFTTTWKAAN